MPRNLLNSFILGAILLLVGCDGSESTAYDEDGREQANPIDNSAPGTLSGRAMDGYLVDARVWLDLDANGRLDDGEPATATTTNGRFELDVSSLARDITVGPDLDPRDYPLALLAIAGQTIDEDNGLPVDKSFVLLAPPGANVVSPFTTLVELERRLRGSAGASTIKEDVSAATERVKVRLGPALQGFSLHLDYLRGDNSAPAMHARVISEFLAVQTNDLLSHGDPRVMLDDGSYRILAGVTLGQVRGIVDQTSAQIEAGAEEINLAAIDIPSFDLSGDDPFVLSRQRLYMKPGFLPNSDPANVADKLASVAGSAPNYLSENLSAELRYFYDAAGRLSEIEVDGWTDPSLAQLNELVRVQGYVAGLDTQFGPGLLVRYSSAFAEDNGLIPQERYVFKWGGDSPSIEWHTNNSSDGFTVPETLDEEPEALIQWSDSGIALIRDGITTELDAEYVDGEPSQFTFDGPEGTSVWNWSDDPETLPEKPEYLCERIAVSTLNYDLYDTFNVPGDGETRRLLNSTRAVEFTENVATPIEWQHLYVGAAGSAPLAPDQPGLLSERRLHLLLEPPAACDAKARQADLVLALATYQHTRLSINLADQTRRE
ncbi:hypothetical protein [Hydrocarboniclastica marina]|uniref:Lipoprotein n=1 Tax=Hydrocarboniclastica marina TaxID=2259620 RepID=A0A4P7XHB5_9ALTE|nr:hypothetical protein [Hydrocarboniclastica marina]QCF25187.1 hypothetical protein soil367_04160 [Hydrocarboniclastica marina]